jgi:hypothetical protein
LKAPAPPPSAEIPDWVPAAVRSYMLQTEQLFAGMPDLAIMHRLATDSRMRNVWRLLEKRAASDGALVEFFACAFQRTRLPYFVTTPKDRAALAAPWSSAARLCRWTKEHDIAAQMNPALAAAADMLARHFDEFARKEGRLDSPMVVGQRQRRLRPRLCPCARRYDQEAIRRRIVRHGGDHRDRRPPAARPLAASAQMVRHAFLT